MSKTQFLFSMVTFVACLVNADQLWLIVSVKDQDGLPVSNATVVVRALNKVGLNAGAYENDYSKFAANTDTNGVAKVVFNTPGNNIVAWVAADDCYPDVSHRVSYKAKPHMLYWADFEEREKELSVVLSRKKQPIQLYSYHVNRFALKSPKENGRYGFDLQKCDWVAPWGNGVVADFYFEKNADLEACTLSFAENCGAYIESDEGTPCSPSTYCAKTNAQFLASLRFSGKRHDGWMKVLDDNEHIVIRSRVIRDDNGLIAKANYSIIDGSMGLGKWIWFYRSVFNPNVNDANLEADRKRNLAKGRFRVR